MNKEQRAALRKLAEEATPGPWIAERDQSHFDTLSTICAGLATSKWPHRELIVQIGGAQRVQIQEGTTRFIASANPSTILQLLDYIETLEKDAARYRWLVDNSYDRDSVTQFHVWKHTWEPHSQTGEPTEWKCRVRGPSIDSAIDAAMQGETE